MGGRSSATAPTRYAGIQVQTSALGLQMPVGWGTFRCKCNLVDYLDFKSKAQKASTGKGGSTTTGYSYSATLVLGLCEGPIADITTVWVDSKQFVGGGGVALGKVGLSMATGAVGQSVWSYLTSHHSDHAIGYSGLAICYASNYPLDSGAATPNHAFEVVSTTRLTSLSLPDASPKAILIDFFTNARYGLPGWTSGLLDMTSMSAWEAYCLAANLVLSPVLDQARTGSDFLKEVLLATNSTCVWSEGLLKFIPYGDTALSGNGAAFTPNLTPVYALDDDSFIPQSDGDDPLMIDIQDQSDAYNIVQIEYLDRSNQYNTAIATAQDMANIEQYGRRKQNPTTIHSICTPAVAQACAQLYLQRTLYIRGQYKFVLPWTYALLEPGDIVELTDAVLGLNAYPVRITQIDDDEEACRSVTAEDLLAGVSHAPLYASQDAVGAQINHAIDPGGVEANLLLWSEDLTQSAYSHSNATIAPNAATGPLFGTASADQIIASASSGFHNTARGFSCFEDVAYSFSAYFKPAGRKCGALQLLDAASNAVTIFFDCSAGTASAPTASGAAILVGGSIVDAGSGWFRVSIIGVFPTSTSLEAIIDLCDDGGDPVWTGDGASGLYSWGWQVKQGVDVPVYAYTAGAIAGPFLFNPPAALATGPQGEACAAVAGGADWGGCYVWTSIDGANYQNIGLIDAPARFGFTTTALPATADPDTTDTLGVDLGLSMGAILGGSAADADASATLCLIDNELIAYETATLSAPYRYALGTYIRRAQMGTALASHVAHAPFVRMDSAVFNFPYIATQAGRAIYVKFQSFNHWGEGLQDLSVCNAYLVTLDPQGVGTGVSSGANRICFSEFEHGAGDGWGTYTSGPAVTTSLSTIGGIVNRVISATATAGGQTISSGSIQFPVTGGERLVASALVGVSSNAAGYLYANFYDATNTHISGAFAAGPLVPCGAGTPEAGFLTVPANAVSATLVAQVNSVAAGAFSLDLARAFVCGAAAEQTTFPPFVKGPAAEYGADITGDWTAAAIVGQAPAATDFTIHTGATKNITTYAATAPASPGDGDIWVDTAVTPYVANLRIGGAWLAASTYVNSTSQIVDGAGLGNTAIWSGVTGAGKAADNATRNVTTYSSSAPPSPTDGDIWVDTASTPPVVYLHAAGGWQLAANLVTNTNEITDGANLGATAVWTGISATPANLAALTGGEAIQNSILQGLIVAGAVAVPSGAVTGLAPAATDITIEAGATFNSITIGPTDPAPIKDGAFWQDTANGVLYARSGGAWNAVSGQMNDGAVIFSASGANSGVVTIPGNALAYALITAKGASGGSGDASGADNLGGGGATSSKHVAVVPGSTTISWSTGVNGVSSGTGTGTSGGPTTVTSTAFSGTMTAGGGGGGSATAVGVGGSASGGDTNTSGSNGAPNGSASITIVTKFS